MAPIVPDVTQYLNYLCAWWLQDGVVMVSSGRNPRAGTIYAVPDSLLGNLHSGLPTAIRVNLDQEEEREEIWTDGRWVQATLNMLKHGITSFADTSGRQRDFTTLLGMTPKTRGAITELEVYGHEVSVGEKVYQGVVHSHITRVGLKTAYTEPSRLNHRYRGWDSRLTLGMALGLNREQLAHFALHGNTRSVLDVELIHELYWPKRTISQRELDSKYPGWSEKLTLGLELGVEPAVLLQSIFTTPTVNEVGLLPIPDLG